MAPGAGEGEVWAGAQSAGLFRSADGDATWASVDGLNLHPDRERWQPGGGGLRLHTVPPDARDARRVIAGVSAVGVGAS